MDAEDMIHHLHEIGFKMIECKNIGEEMVEIDAVIDFIDNTIEKLRELAGVR